MTQPLLELKGITRSFIAGEKAFIALKDINLTINAGEVVAITGASGSGKSTLMNVLGCLDHPSAGSYKVDGRETGSMNDRELAVLRRDHFGFIFQRYHLLPHLSALHNVEMPAIYAGAAESQRHSRAGELLTRLGLMGHLSNRPNQLSGGQQQRVSIARALMNGGDIILADEPTGALDTTSGKEVMKILLELNRAGHTVIIVTHDEKVAAHAQRIIEIRDGEIVSDRPNPQQPLEDQSPQGTRPAKVKPVNGLRASFGLFSEAFNMAWVALISHRMRTLLTMLGIIIGITSVVSIVAIGEGVKAYVLKDIQAIGSNTIEIMPGADWGDSRSTAIETLVLSDVTALGDQYYIDSATPNVGRNLLLRFENIDINATVNGVSESYFQVRGIKIGSGVAFSKDDARRQSQVVVIDHNTRQRLFPNSDPLGKVILIDNLPCTIIGVTEDRKSVFNTNKNLNVWMPYETAAGRLLGQRFLDSVTVRIKDGQPSKIVEDHVVKLLTQRHGIKDFFTYNLDSVMQTVQKTSQSLALLLSLIAIISLVVGGIGVMNIMLVSVTERTREIGIRMAVGARQSDIRQQFLVEAVMVCLMGGMIGIALSFGIGYVFSIFVKEWQMVFSVGSIITAVVCSTLIGVVFGFVPARNAARLDPINALARD